jgi:3-phosphoshikimate 1-carboxyvinyltransferase
VSPSRSLPDPLLLHPSRLGGELFAPPSKSATNRALLLAAAASEETFLENGSDEAEDTRLLGEALRRIGIGVEGCGAGRIRVSPHPSGFEPPRSPEPVAIEVGNGGTTVRFLLPLLCRTAGRFRVDGSPRMRERPIGGLVRALRSLGAAISCPEREGFLPLEIRGGGLRGGRTRLDASASSQYLSALLLAAPSLDGGLEVELDGELASASYVRVTGGLLEQFGHRLEVRQNRFRVAEGPTRGGRFVLESDWSGSTYLLGAAALAGGEISIRGLAADSPQGDARFLDWLRGMGGAVRWVDGALVAGPAAPLRGVEVDAAEAPDAVPTLAVVAAFADGETVIRGAPQLRIKESDRIGAVCEALRTIGAEAEELPDGLLVRGNPALRRRTDPVRVRTREDHRLAMAFALAGLAREGVSIENPVCAGKSYPRFWEDLGRLGAIYTRTEIT